MVRCEVWGVRCKFNYCCRIQYCPGGLAVYWRGLCRPERGQRGHTESHSWLVSLVRTRRETETEVTLVPTATVKDWKLSAFKLKKTVEKEKERSSSWEQEPGRDSCNHQRGKVGANYIKTLIADGCTTLHITLYTLLSSSQEYFPCSVLAPISII